MQLDSMLAPVLPISAQRVLIRITINECAGDPQSNDLPTVRLEVCGRMLAGFPTAFTAMRSPVNTVLRMTSAVFESRTQETAKFVVAAFNPALFHLTGFDSVMEASSLRHSLSSLTDDVIPDYRKFALKSNWVCRIRPE